MKQLHGPPVLIDQINFGLVLYNHANFYQFEETSSYWSVERISVFLCFSLVNQRHTSGITVYNRTVTNIENTVRVVHSCNSWFAVIKIIVIFSLMEEFGPIVAFLEEWKEPRPPEKLA